MNELQPQFAGHETFPLRQLWLRKAYAEVGAFQPNAAPRPLFADQESIARFGVGRNMVAAMRHWALACDVIGERDGGYRPSNVGELLFGTNGVDPYGEFPGTAWLIHWLLAGRASRTTTWYWIFNHIPNQTFDRSAVVLSLKEWVTRQGLEVTEVTLRRDVDACVRSYLPKLDGKSREDLAEPVLADLGLLRELSSGVFTFRRGEKRTLTDGVFVFALLDFWERHAAGTETLAFDRIAHGYGSPGRVFKLDETSVTERLIAIAERSRGALHWSDTAGVQQIIRKASKPDKYDLLRRLYEE